MTGSKVRYSFDNSGNDVSDNPMVHGWIYEFQVFYAVSKLEQALTLVSSPNIKFGETATFPANGGSSDNPIIFASLTPSVCTSSGDNGSTITASTIGHCVIIVNQDGNADYFPASTLFLSFEVGKADQTIELLALPEKTYGDPPFPINATASSGLPVAFSSLTTAVCSVTGNTVTLTGAGTCTIAADQVGDANYNPAPQVTQSFTVAKADQTITFNALTSRTYRDPAFKISSIASSNLAVTFSSLTKTVCWVSGDTVSTVGAGTCTIAAD